MTDTTELKEAIARQTIILQHIAETQGEIKQTVRETNDRVGKHGELLASLVTWRGEHEYRHERLDAEVGGLRGRVNALGVVNAVWTAVGSAVAAVLGRQP